MPALSALRLAVYLVVAAGIAALHLGGLVGFAGFGIFGAALALGWWLRDRNEASPTRLRLLIAGIALVAAVDVLYVAESAFEGFVRLLVLLVLLRLFTARAPRELRDAGLLAFFMLVASTAVTFDVGFLFVFVAFVVAGVAMLILAQDLVDAERAGGPEAVRRAQAAGRGFIALGLAGSAGALLVTLALFFVIPRVGEATLALRQPLRRMLIGFTDRVELGAIGELESDSSVAMRVELPDGAPPAPVVAQLRWRGVALDRFDGTAWTADRLRRVAFRRASTGAIDIARGGDGGLRLTQAIFLEPIGTDAVFAAPHALRLWIRGGSALLDDTGAMAVPAPAARLSYTVESAVGAEPWGGPLDAAETARYLQLPPLSPRIPALARQVAAGAGNDLEAAQALVRFLMRDFRYTLTLERTTTLSPLEEFLFVRRAGNCEYFAAALAVMLRTLGIPARVVNGFQRGEWNPYGGYFLVRMGDAHSWVEAHVGHAGWITLDASPRQAADAAGGSPSVSLWLDSLRVRWYRYIVSWSRQDQVQVAAAIGRVAWTSSPWRLSWRGWSIPATGLALPALALGAAGLAWLAWRRTGPGGLGPGAPPVPRFYRRALRALARRGLRPTTEETAREFAARVAEEAPAVGAPFARVTTAYESVRFGGMPLDGVAAASLEGALTALTRRER
jgi:transglutaminase-like putative cysteine protease